MADEGTKMKTQEYKWSLQKLLIKLSSASLWAWGAATVLVFIVCIFDFIIGGEHPWINTVIIGWIIITCFFIGGKVLVDALAVAVSNAKIEASVNLNGGIGK